MMSQYLVFQHHPEHTLDSTATSMADATFETSYLLPHPLDFVEAGFKFDEELLYNDGKVCFFLQPFRDFIDMVDELHDHNIDPIEYIEDWVQPGVHNLRFMRSLRNWPTAIPDWDLETSFLEHDDPEAQKNDVWLHSFAARYGIRLAYELRDLYTSVIDELTVVDAAEVASELCPNGWLGFSEDVPDVDTTPLKTPCNHVFMKDCLLEWFKTSKAFSCPMCRRDIKELLASRSEDAAAAE